MKCLLSILVILTSCKLTEKNISGVYQDYSTISEHSTFLQINKNHSFHFEQKASLLVFQADGEWQYRSDTLYLITKDTIALINHDTSALNLAEQEFVIKGRKLIKVFKNKLTQLELKRNP